MELLEVRQDLRSVFWKHGNPERFWIDQGWKSSRRKEQEQRLGLKGSWVLAVPQHLGTSWYIKPYTVGSLPSWYEWCCVKFCFSSSKTDPSLERYSDPPIQQCFLLLSLYSTCGSSLVSVLSVIHRHPVCCSVFLFYLYTQFWTRSYKVVKVKDACVFVS